MRRTIGAVLAVAAATIAAGAAVLQETATGATTTTVGIGLHDFFITKSVNGGRHGTFTFVIRNRGAVTHNFRIRRGTAGTVLAKTTNIVPGDSRTKTLTLAAGTYTIFCNLHPNLMHVKFTVS